MKVSQFRKVTFIFLVLLIIVAILFLLSGPKVLFPDVQYSTIILSEDNQLLSASVSTEEQWYFPEVNELPEKYKKAVTTFEDKRFYTHIGVDIIALARALRSNLKAGKVVSGASTISMQTIRLHRKNPPRTIYQKFIEIILALRIELRYSKDEILKFYANHAPFGGNVIGIEAASWRYFGKSLNNISWAEATLLAVLPNSPGLIHTEKNRKKLKLKRDGLLKKLLETNQISISIYETAILEEIPRRAKKLPSYAPHLLIRLQNQHGHDVYHSSIDLSLQQKCNLIAKTQGQVLKQNNIHNMAILVLDLETNKTLAYVGNLPETGIKNQSYVDIIQAERSTGSLLKPFLYTASLEDGIILPKSFLPDYPLQMNGFEPENYNSKHNGLIPADEALIRSLNIPYAYLLQQHGIAKFIHLLRKLGLNSVDQNQEYYGIPLILGGVECSLWELTNAYGFLGKTMNTYNAENGFYDKSDIKEASLLAEAITNKTLVQDPCILRAENIWQCLKTIQQVKRPDEQGRWEKYESNRPIAWKTGTSNGFKDAWAIGVNKKYAIGVWVGNADGEGRPGIIGSKAAAPVLFRVINSLDQHQWFQEPIDDLKSIPICSITGNLANENCPTDSIKISTFPTDYPFCKYHKKIFLDRTGQYQVFSDCYNMDLAFAQKFLQVPPKVAYYYKNQSSYKIKPSIHPDCREYVSKDKIQIIYPNKNIKIYQPKTGLDERNPFVLKAFHTSKESEIFWHIDETFYGTTKNIHELPVLLKKGKHLLTIWDNMGNEDSILFEIIE